MLDVRNFSRDIGIDFGCTCEDVEGAKFLREIDVDFIKIPSSAWNIVCGV